MSATLTAAICCYAQLCGKITGLLDEPDGVRKLHGDTTPLIGGLAIFVPSFAVSFVYQIETHNAAFMPMAVIAPAIMLIVGMLDDRFGVSPAWRIAAFLAVVWTAFALRPLFVLHALRFDLPGLEFAVPLGLLAVPVTTLVVIGFVNAVNMADGMNGQLIGSVTVWCLFIAAHLGLATGIAFVAVAASSLAALFFNLRGRLFSGSSGAYAASLLVALGAIAAYRRSEGTMPAQLPVFWFWLPVLDCLRVMVSRILQHKSPFAGDRNHLHHILLGYVRPRYALAIYLALLAAPGAAAEFDLQLGGAVLLASVVLYAAIVLIGQLRFRAASSKDGKGGMHASANTDPSIATSPAIPPHAAEAGNWQERGNIGISR